MAFQFTSEQDPFLCSQKGLGSRLMLASILIMQLTTYNTNKFGKLHLWSAIICVHEGKGVLHIGRYKFTHKKQLTHYLFFIMHVFLNVLQVERVPQHFQVTICVQFKINGTITEFDSFPFTRNLLTYDIIRYATYQRHSQH